MTSFSTGQYQTRMHAADITSLAEKFKQNFWDFAVIENGIMLFSTPFSFDPNDALDQLQLELIKLQCENNQHCRQE